MSGNGMNRTKVAIVGCGAIGRTIALSSDGYEVTAVFDRNPEKAEELAKVTGARALKSFEELVEICRRVDVVVEAASQSAVRELLPVLEFTNLLVMSVGAFANPEVVEIAERIAGRSGKRIFVPSGAVGGIDALKAVRDVAEEVVLTTIKSPESLRGAPFFEKHREVEVDEIGERTLIFEGSAKEAVTLFPANVNVAATVSLACLGFEKTKVRIFADPHVKENIHEVFVRGEFGEMKFIFKNRKHPKNPKTSYLAALSAVRLLKSFGESIKVGTL